MAIPWVRDAKPWVHDTRKTSRSPTPVSKPVKAILDLQQKYDKCWSVSRLMTWLTRYQPDQVWSQWLEEVKAFTKRHAAPATTTQPMETWSAATAATTQPVITEKGYRGYTFRFFQYVRRITKAMNKNHAIHDWFSEKRCKVGPNRSISALIINDSEMKQVLEDFIPEVRAWHASVFGADGTLVSLLTCPITTDQNTEVFSAVVHGNHLGRMEWLSFDLVAEACKVLEQDREKLECTY